MLGLIYSQAWKAGGFMGPANTTVLMARNVTTTFPMALVTVVYFSATALTLKVAPKL